MPNITSIFVQSRCLFHAKFYTFKFVPVPKLYVSQRAFSQTVFYQQKRKTAFEKLPSDNVEGDDGRTKARKTALLTGIAVLIGAAIVAARAVINWDLSDLEKNVEAAREKPKAKFPASAKDIPKKVPYLLIGGGTSSFSAFRAIKSSDPTAKVLVVSNELYYPYMRPPLSKEMWYQNDKDILTKLKFKQWNGTERSIFFEPVDFYVESKDLENEPKGGIAVIRGWTATKVDAEHKKVTLDDDTEIEYDKCLIATGVRPKNLPAFEKSADVHKKVTLFRNIDDFKTLYKAIKDGAKSVIVVGGGLLGSELAAALAKDETSEVKVTQIFPEKGSLAKILPQYLSSWTTNKIREQGVEIIPEVDVEAASLSNHGKQIELTLSNGRKISADHAIIAVGSVVNNELAEASHLEIDKEHGGLLVNNELAVRSDLYAAGDCACYFDNLLGRRRIEHHDHAVASGKVAGENMTGARKSYTHQPMFWSEIGPILGFEAVGLVDSSLQTVAIYAKIDESEETSQTSSEIKDIKSDEKSSTITTARPKEGENYEKGVIFYLRNDLIVGVVLWNVFNRITLARQVLKEQRKYDDLNEVAKLFDIHSE